MCPRRRNPWLGHPPRPSGFAHHRTSFAPALKSRRVVPIRAGGPVPTDGGVDVVRVPRVRRVRLRPRGDLAPLQPVSRPHALRGARRPVDGRPEGRERPGRAVCALSRAPLRALTRPRILDAPNRGRHPRRCGRRTVSSRAEASPSASAESSGAMRSHSAPDSTPCTRRTKLRGPSGHAPVDLRVAPTRDRADLGL